MAVVIGLPVVSDTGLAAGQLHRKSQGAKLLAQHFPMITLDLDPARLDRAPGAAPLLAPPGQGLEPRDVKGQARDDRHTRALASPGRGA